MAITYIVGNPGSGKTYFAVYKIYEFFVVPTLPDPKIFGFKIKRKTKAFDYSYCYSNINGLKFTISQKLLPFDFEVFYLNLIVLYNLYNQNVSDDQLNLKANELKLFKAMFIIDEAHNILKNKDDKILVWWLTYHRHLHQEIIFITQDLSLISNEYKRIAEFFYKALDSGKRIFKSSLRYVQFSSYKMYQKDLVPGGKFSLRTRQEVFDLYQSGQKQSGTPFLRRIFIFLFSSLFFLGIVFYYFLSYFTDTTLPETNSSTPVNFQNYQDSSLGDFQISRGVSDSNYNSPSSNSNFKLDSFFYRVVCFSDFCSIHDKDGNFYAQIPIDFFNFAIDKNKPLYHHKDRIFKGYIHFLFFEKSIFENLKKGVKDEKGGNFSLSKF